MTALDKNFDEKFIRMTLTLAKHGKGKVEPNPLVGCVIVKNGTIVSRGWHRSFGQPHAEAEAIKKVIDENPRQWREILRGSTLYVNLEPCCHATKEKKTPPCVPLIIKSGVKKVVAGMIDPNPAVAGKGLNILRKSGIEAISNVLEEECREINKIYIKNITTSMPYTLLKSAVTLDGKIASFTGDSKWITSRFSRNYVHKLRGEYDAVLVGVGTLAEDNPSLTAHGKGRDPIRIVVDPDGRARPESKIFSKGAPVILVTTPFGESKLTKKKFVRRPRVIQIKPKTKDDKKIDFRRIMKVLYLKCGIKSVLIEGGGSTNWEAVKSGVPDEYLFFIAPKIVGGAKAKTSVEGDGYAKIKFARMLEIKKVFRLGNDIVISAKNKD